MKTCSSSNRPTSRIPCSGTRSPHPTELSALAAKRGVSNATLAYAWLLHKGVTAPIVGASKTTQLDQAAAALEIRLTDEEVKTLEAPYQPHPVLGHL